MKSVVKYMLLSGLFLLTLDMCVALNIRGVSAKVVKTKRDSDSKLGDDTDADFFPDWVPFKENVEELEELVTLKEKPKKRLALPVNFLLKSAADYRSDDIYYKGEGETDAEEDFEKREWQDTNRPPVIITEKPKVMGEIDGLRTLHKPSNDDKVIRDESLNESYENINHNNNKNATDIDEDEMYKKSNTHLEKDAIKKPIVKGDSEYEDDSEEEKVVKEEEKAKKEEEEAKKKKVIQEVDELIKKHTEEQRLISEKVKDENKNSFDESDEKYNKYDSKAKPKIEYDEDYDDVINIHDKYPKYSVMTSPKTSTEDDTLPQNSHQTYVRPFDEEKFDFTPTIEKNQTTDKRKTNIFGSKIDVDDQKKDNQKTITQYEVENPSGLTEKYTNTFVPTLRVITKDDDNVRISLVPTGDESHNEPTTFFIKRSKKHKRKKVKTTTAPPDTSVAETIEDKISAQESIKDAVPASTEHKKEGGGDSSHEAAGEKEHHSEHHSKHEDHGVKRYEAVHTDKKTTKGHHDKEKHLGDYKDEGGHDKHHHDEDGHYGSHHHEERGKKHAQYEESGKHSKGHSTKGSHNIHKKDEYEKKVEFFEEDGDSGEEEKYGGYKNEKEHSQGGHYKKGKYKEGHDERAKGDSASFAEGGHVVLQKGYKAAAGHDAHGKSGHAEHNQGHEDGGKKWIYHHGYPAKTSNLVVIDRRADQYINGPRYYG